MDNIESNIELTTFLIGETLCGMDILQIQEINKITHMTQVPQAPDYVLGIQNLRGQIVTVLDLGKKLGLSQTASSSDPRNVIVNSPGGHIGLLVSGIGDVVTVEKDQLERPPANMNGIQGEFFTDVFKEDDNLIGILDVEKVLAID